MTYKQHKEQFEKMSALFKFDSCFLCEYKFKDEDQVLELGDEPVCYPCYENADGKYADFTQDYWEALAENMEEAQATGN